MQTVFLSDSSSQFFYFLDFQCFSCSMNIIHLLQIVTYNSLAFSPALMGPLNLQSLCGQIEKVFYLKDCFTVVYLWLCREFIETNWQLRLTVGLDWLD